LANDSNWDGDIYLRLEKHRVPNVAPFGNGNDVLCPVWSKQTTGPVLKAVYRRHEGHSDDEIQKHKPLEELVWYRMSLKVIGDGLRMFESTKQFVTAIADAMEGDTLIPHSLTLMH